MSHALLIDFGSTYTKLRAISLDPPRIVASGQGPSTVTTDVREGMDLALADLERRMGVLPTFRHRLACSSAAGGLRMVTVGLVRELTARAAREAALGAGARLVGTFAQHLTAGDVAGIEAAAPDVLLLAGGTDGGNRDVLLHNAGALAASRLGCPIVLAGNRSVADEAAALLVGGGKEVSACANVMPDIGVLDITPAREAVREVFMRRIVHAKGIDRAGDAFDRVLMPTPVAVMDGARLLADGAGDVAGAGPVMVVDVGGATTDVHSVAHGEPSRSGVLVHGLPEPYVKRTVEGDLGMRHNVRSIVEQAGADTLAADAGVDAATLRDRVERLAGDVGRLPGDEVDEAVDRALARAAVALAVRRHAGTVETVFTAQGPVDVQRGKDLGEVALVVGTGGVLAHARSPRALLAGALADPGEPGSLRPRGARLAVDRDYVLFAAGLLAAVAPEQAAALANAHIDVEERNDERSIAGS